MRQLQRAPALQPQHAAARLLVKSRLGAGVAGGVGLLPRRAHRQRQLAVPHAAAGDAGGGSGSYVAPAWWSLLVRADTSALWASQAFPLKCCEAFAMAAARARQWQSREAQKDT